MSKYDWMIAGLLVIVSIVLGLSRFLLNQLREGLAAIREEISSDEIETVTRYDQMSNDELERELSQILDAANEPSAVMRHEHMRRIKNQGVN